MITVGTIKFDFVCRAREILLAVLDYCTSWYVIYVLAGGGGRELHKGYSCLLQHVNTAKIYVLWCRSWLTFKRFCSAAHNAALIWEVWMLAHCRWKPFHMRIKFHLACISADPEDPQHKSLCLNGLRLPCIRPEEFPRHVGPPQIKWWSWAVGAARRASEGSWLMNHFRQVASSFWMSQYLGRNVWLPLLETKSLLDLPVTAGRWGKYMFLEFFFLFCRGLTHQAAKYDTASLLLLALWEPSYAGENRG